MISKTTLVKARSYIANKPVSGTVEKKFEQIQPGIALSLLKAEPGLQANYYEGEWNRLPDFRSLTAKENEIIKTISPGKYKDKEKYGVVIDGYIQVPATDIYYFTISSDDGSSLYIDGKLVIVHDGLHSLADKKGEVALEAGFHSIRVEFFQKTGGDDLKLSIESIKMKMQELAAGMLFH